MRFVAIKPYMIVFSLLLSVNGPLSAQEDIHNLPVATVVRLYRDYAWEAVVEEPNLLREELLSSPPDVLRKYFDGQLVALLLKDRNCGQAMCNLDFMPMWAGQDAGGTTVSIKATESPTVVTVRLRQPDYSCVELTYYLKKAVKGWRISDIKGAEWSLVSILSQPIETDTAPR
jgi:hypothetical protein